MTSRDFVAYIRIDGLDFEEQVACVEEHAGEAGGRVLKRYRDEERLDSIARPGLRKAIAYARRRGASLIIATLHGLADDIGFLRQLEAARIDFMACDLPEANGATIHALRALAEYRARRRVAVGRGRNLTAEARARGAKRAGDVQRARAAEAYRGVAPLIQDLRAGGFSLEEIADRLNEAGHTTRQGRPWNAMQVSRVLRLGGTPKPEAPE